MSASRGLVLDALLEWLDFGQLAQVAQLNQSLNGGMNQWRARQRSVSLRHLVGVSGGACRTLTVGLPGRQGWAWDDEVVGPIADAALRVVKRFYANLATLDLTACLFTSQVLIDLSEACTKLQRIVDTESQWNRTIVAYDPRARTEADVGGYGITLTVTNQLQGKRPGLTIERHAVRFEVYLADEEGNIDRSEDPILMSLDECRPYSELWDALGRIVGFKIAFMGTTPDSEGLERFGGDCCYPNFTPLVEMHRRPYKTLSELQDFRERTPICLTAFEPPGPPVLI